MTEDSKTYLEGHLSISAAIAAHSRDIHKLYIAKKPNQDKRTIELIDAADAPVEYRDRNDIDTLAGGTTHGGIIAAVGPRKFTDLEKLLPDDRPAFIVMLDGIEDPHSFAHAVRSIYAAGADGLVLKPRNWTSAAATVARTSAGTSELIPTAIVETPQHAADVFKSRGLAIAVAAKTDNASSIYDADLTKPLFILMGGEKRGVQRSFVDQADLILQIPYAADFQQSLSTAPAAAVIAFEIMRQRRERQPHKGHQDPQP